MFWIAYNGGLIISRIISYWMSKTRTIYLRSILWYVLDIVFRLYDDSDIWLKSTNLVITKKATSHGPPRHVHAKCVSLTLSTTPPTTSWSVPRLLSRVPSSPLIPPHSVRYYFSLGFISFSIKSRFPDRTLSDGKKLKLARILSFECTFNILNIFEA